jgi:hypothetical protein
MSTNFNRFDRLEEILMEGFSEEEILLEILDLLPEDTVEDLLNEVEDLLVSERESEGEDDVLEDEETFDDDEEG